MADGGINYKYFFIMFTFCIGPSEGRWKRRDKENLHRDIEMFKRTADNIEHEMETFYEDYPDDGQIKRDDMDKVQQEFKNIFRHETGAQKVPDRNVTWPSFTTYATNKISQTPPSDNTRQSALDSVSFVNNDSLLSKPNWPKFEDLLLNMGKRYDWTHGRWIKVKRKSKGRNRLLKKSSLGDNINLHKKRKFNYRTIKLNRKSRRNIVIAVTAVR